MTRDRKELLSPEEVLARHRELAAQYGHQADRVVAEAREHSQRHVYEPDRIAQQAVTYARDHLFERSAVLDRREILEAALNRGMGETTYAHVRQEFAQRAARGEFRAVDHAGAGQQYTTAAMVRMEREIVTRMQEGNQRGVSDGMLVDSHIRVATEGRHPELNASQHQAVEQIFLSREKMVGLDGVAGAGKTLRSRITIQACCLLLKAGRNWAWPTWPSTNFYSTKMGITIRLDATGMRSSISKRSFSAQRKAKFGARVRKALSGSSSSLVNFVGSSERLSMDIRLPKM